MVGKLKLTLLKSREAFAAQGLNRQRPAAASGCARTEFQNSRYVEDLRVAPQNDVIPPSFPRITNSLLMSIEELML